ncbi:hypothetical protein FSP39_000258 [Pinctada imbricata]|uniref:Endonuclease/exonuclease/phosphatase domain-containing protein n=1 Tax=Pinctada imbricata TaxID=66713 RepID=A0AA88YRQ2_PINIB|nr:hypothetical protein FSP39_000258 [Pinctada imbricata]
MQYKRRRDFEQGHIETIWLEVVIPNNKSIFLCSAYRPPSAPTSWIEYLSDEITSACSCNNNEIILCGDFNIYYLNDPPRYWTNALEQFEFTQVIDKPTRVTDKSATLIDHIYTNKPENFHEIKVSFIAISDHYPVCVTRKTSCEKSPKRHYSIQYRDFKHFDEQHFLRQLASSDLHEIESIIDPNAALTKFYDIFLKVLNANAKIKTKRVKHHYKPSWINAEINEARIKRDRFHKAKDMINYKVWRNKVTGLLRKSKTDYYQSAIKNNQRPGDIWKHMANLAPKSSKSAPNSITYKRETLTDAKNNADKFNEYYVKLCDNLGLIDHDNEKTLKLLKDFTQSRLGETQSFKLKEINEEDVFKLLRNLNPNKSTGTDTIGPRILKVAASIISRPITYLINTSIQNGVFPDQLKSAKVTPIFKKVIKWILEITGLSQSSQPYQKFSKNMSHIN